MFWRALQRSRGESQPTNQSKPHLPIASLSRFQLISRNGGWKMSTSDTHHYSKTNWKVGRDD